MGLRKSGTDANIFKGQSTRHANTSAATKQGVSLDSIHKTAGCTETSDTFIKYYNSPIIANPCEFATKILAGSK
nr:unnamed protein product [Callosobruchus analis]